jgi:hypothetical protein
MVRKQKIAIFLKQVYMNKVNITCTTKIYRDSLKVMGDIEDNTLLFTCKITIMLGNLHFLHENKIVRFEIRDR